MQSIIQILKLNEPRQWNMDGRSGVSHSAECLLLTDTGEVDQVGVLKLRGDDIIKAAKPGHFSATFALRANPSSRVVEAMIVALVPLPEGWNRRASAASSKAA